MEAGRGNRRGVGGTILGSVWAGRQGQPEVESSGPRFNCGCGPSLVESMGWFHVKLLLFVSLFLASSARAPTPVLSAQGKQTVL